MHRFISTISVWTQPGCKDPAKDPSAEEQGDPFKDGLPGWCNTKKAASIFFWIAFGQLPHHSSKCSATVTDPIRNLQCSGVPPLDS